MVNGGIFINRQHDVFFMHLRNVAAQKMWSHFTRFVFFSISLHSGPALFEAPSKRIIMAYPQCVHDHYIYFLGVVQLATRKKANRTTACPHKLTDFFSVKLLTYSYTRHENPEALQIFCFKFNFFDESSFLLPSGPQHLLFHISKILTRSQNSGKGFQ